MFSLRLSSVRRRRGLSQADLAERVGVHENQISRYETGESQPKVDTITLLAKELDVSTDFLLGLTEYPGPHIEGELTDYETAVIAAIRRGDKVEAIKAIVGE